MAANVHKWRGHERPGGPPRSGMASGTVKSSRLKPLLYFFLGAGTALALVSFRSHNSLPSGRRLGNAEDAGHPFVGGSRVSEAVESLVDVKRNLVPDEPPPASPPPPPPPPPKENQGFVSRVDLGEIARGIAVNGTVILIVSNQGYQDFLENWVAFAEKLGLAQHLLVVAEDWESWQHVQEHWPGHAVRLRVPELEDADKATARMLGLQGVGSGSAGGAASEFNSPRFKMMMYRRVFYIRELLYARVNVLLTDSDVVFLRNPLPYLQNPRRVGNKTAPPFDFVGMLDEPDGKGFRLLKPHAVARNSTLRYLTQANFCGGFLFFRCNPAAWVMVDLLAMKLLRAVKVTGKENEQTYLAQVMWEALQLKPPARLGVLPQQLFVPGWLYFNDTKYRWWRQRFVRNPKNKPVIVHNNWVLGKQAKIERFIGKGLWALPHPEGSSDVSQSIGAVQ